MSTTTSSKKPAKSSKAKAPKNKSRVQPVARTVRVKPHQVKLMLGKASPMLALNKKLYDEALRNMVAMAFPHFAHGTQMITMQLRYLYFVTSDIAGQIKDNYPVRLSNYAHATEIETIFDEFRIRRAHFHFVPLATYAYQGTGYFGNVLCGYVDYENSTNLLSLSEAWENDTSKMFSSNAREEWAVKPIGIPDEAWTATTAASTTVAWLKLYGDSFSISTNYGVLAVTMDVEFRQVR